MMYPEGLMHRKIHLAIALLVIILIAAAFAYAISVEASSYSWMGGGKVISYIAGCTMATPVPPSCPGKICPCGVCGCVSAPCTPPPPRWSEVIFQPYGSNQVRYFCPLVGFPIIGGVPMTGNSILGIGTTAYNLFRLGTAK